MVLAGLYGTIYRRAEGRSERPVKPLPAMEDKREREALVECGDPRSKTI
jgi:hypothetical protein